jgi:HK97 gp10 family phage protein
VASVTVKVEGLQQLGEAMRELTEKMNKSIMRSAVRASTKPILTAARSKVSVDTGALKESIQIRRSRRDSHPGYEQWIVGVFKISGGRYANTKANVRSGRVGKEFFIDPPTHYGTFIEYGTVKMSPKPYLRPAFDEQKYKAVEIMKEKIKDGIEKANKLK